MADPDASPATTMIELKDDLGRVVTLAAPAARVVSLVPSITESFFVLGRGDAVCGATRYCVEPAGQMQHVTRVGGTKNPDVARIIALAPDLILINPEENRRADFDALEAAGVALFVSFPQRVADVPRMLRQLGLLVDASAAAERQARAAEAALTEAATWASGGRPRVFCPIWRNPWMSVNHDTFIDDVLSLAGGRNVCGDAVERYCAVTLAAIAERAPQVVLLPDEPYVFGPKDLPALVPLRETPALRSDRVYFVDGKALAWYGPRTADALRMVHGLLHPRAR